MGETARPALAECGPVADAIDDLLADGHVWTYNPVRILELAASAPGS